MRSIAFALTAVVAVAGCRHTRPSLDEFAQRVEARRAELRIPGLSVAVVHGGRVVMARGFGTSTADTLYPIGSITKTFTSTLMLQLAEEGKLDLDAPVQPYVDWQVPADVRIRHVLSHTSEGVPGTRYVYSTRFNWLDNVVEAAMKENFGELLSDRVLKPAALQRTIGGETGGLATPHRIDEHGAVVESKLPPLALHSSSGLSSTVTDLARYSIALDDGTLLSTSARERAWTPAYPGFPYGLGWFTQTLAGERVVWHTSWWPDAFSGLLVKVPARGLTLVLLANSDMLVSPQQGASNVLLYPIAADFLRTWLGDVGEPVVSDADRMRLYGDRAAGEVLIAAFPEDLHIQFDLAMLYGNVRPALRINGPDAARALALFESIAVSTREKPKWMHAWSNYLVAEHIAAREPARAKTFAERALATGVDTDGLRGRVEKLLAGL